MRRLVGRSVLLLAVLALIATACNGDDSAPTTSSSTTVPDDSTTTTTQAGTTTSTSSTTTSTTLPPGEVFAVQDDTDDDKVIALQILLNCNNVGDLTVDGEYGPATAAAVEAAQTALGRAIDGSQIDEDTFADLSRTCPEDRRIEPDDGTVVLWENAAVGDPAEFPIALNKDDLLTATLTSGAGASLVVRTDAGLVVSPNEDGTWSIETTGEHVIMVESDLDPVTFSITVTVEEGVAALGQWIIHTDGISYEGEKLTFDEAAQDVVDQVFEWLGHGVRGAYDEFDTGWYEITDPQSLGLRGVFIEGIALLFFGPHAENTGRAETFERVRFEGPSDDAEGNPRPDDYVTTAEGITVGDTLADLKAAYGSDVAAGSNSTEHYYRYTDSRGELCFYFGSGAPSDSDAILEIATECRS